MDRSEAINEARDLAIWLEWFVMHSFDAPEPKGLDRAAWKALRLSQVLKNLIPGPEICVMCGSEYADREVHARWCKGRLGL